MKLTYPAVRVVGRIEFGLRSMKCLKLADQQSESRSCVVVQDLWLHVGGNPAAASQLCFKNRPAGGSGSPRGSASTWLNPFVDKLKGI
jgi:hypothetical protein